MLKQKFSGSLRLSNLNETTLGKPHIRLSGLVAQYDPVGTGNSPRRFNPSLDESLLIAELRTASATALPVI
jgi:hypothetical protein